jgi:hypothetical protein
MMTETNEKNQMKGAQTACLILSAALAKSVHICFLLLITVPTVRILIGAEV